MQNDTNVVGMNPWHWNTWGGSMDEEPQFKLGAREFPKLRARLNEIGQIVKGGGYGELGRRRETERQRERESLAPLLRRQVVDSLGVVLFRNECVSLLFPTLCSAIKLRRFRSLAVSLSLSLSLSLSVSRCLSLSLSFSLSLCLSTEQI